MSASSVNRKVAEVQKAQKMERRNAIEKRNEPVNDKPKHIEAEIRGVPAGAGLCSCPIHMPKTPVITPITTETKAL